MPRVVITATIGQYTAGWFVSIALVVLALFNIRAIFTGKFWAEVGGDWTAAVMTGCVSILPGTWIFCRFCWSALRRLQRAAR